MPIYEYECLKCGARFELRRSMADSDRKAECPRCRAQSTKRIFSTFATPSAGSSCAPSTPT